MKKKLTLVVTSLVLVAAMVIGGTLAYFTDTDTKTNVFTTGKVDITLNDEFEQNSKLVPAVLDKETNEILNAVDKIVSVTNNTGSEEAYVRVHIAVPSSITNLIGLWNDGAANWNWTDNDTRIDYTAAIDGVEYDVVCLTYSEKLAANATTSNVFNWVVLDPDATNEDVEDLNGRFNIEIFAEGCQAAGFPNAFAALEEAFGTPSADANPWNNYDATTDGE